MWFGIYVARVVFGLFLVFASSLGFLWKSRGEGGFEKYAGHY